jgi:glutathione S-transferase
MQGKGKYRLYGWWQTGPMAPEAAFAEAGVDYDFVPVSRKTNENLTEDFRKINPRLQLPALMLPDCSVMTEGAAMLLHIGDAFPEARLIPKPGSSARAQHDRWLAFFAVNVYEGELRQLRPGRYTTEPNGADGVKAAADAYVERHFQIYNDILGPGPYLFDDHFTMIDIYVWMLAQWMEQPWLAQHCPKVKRLADTAMARPLIAPIHKAHFA